jgi:hypothetical protein
MVKVKKPINESPTPFKIMVLTYKEAKSSYEISKILRMSQPNIYRQMQSMRENFLELVKGKKYLLNKNNLILTFLEFLWLKGGSNSGPTDNIWFDNFSDGPLVNKAHEKFNNNKYLLAYLDKSFNNIETNISKLSDETLVDFFFGLSSGLSSYRQIYESYRPTHFFSEEYSLIKKKFDALKEKDSEFEDFLLLCQLSQVERSNLIDSIMYHVVDNFLEELK